MDDEQKPKISSEISLHINDKQLGRLNSYPWWRCSFDMEQLIVCDNISKWMTVFDVNG